MSNMAREKACWLRFVDEVISLDIGAGVTKTTLFFGIIAVNSCYLTPWHTLVLLY
jgi:hypothetical protein